MLGHPSVAEGLKIEGDMISPIVEMGTACIGFIHAASAAYSSWDFADSSDTVVSFEAVLGRPKVATLPAPNCLFDGSTNVPPLHLGELCLENSGEGGLISPALADPSMTIISSRTKPLAAAVWE